ncbi:cell division protein FtsA [Halothermothrix orenii]|uniref:Cell division protein FtsA n=1 Tax=Halothermothrix orenii (strain H 168 / OCM 544 / DSM 9562) TaxID=373903 RepID=B8CY20_HALOH|nr:cell division protein FtsA [Halothermothrix orenii]ACL70189.1 cell division protein FtsA [Halothermothrix orenii H 168]
MDKKGDIIFALDIGTRTVIGLVLEYTGFFYEIIASYAIEHENRAMLDGQIHNVEEVARQVRKVKDKLEEELGFSLKKVAIAAAGRALKTATYRQSMEFNTKKLVTREDVQALEFSAVQKAQEELAASDPTANPHDYHFVGYNVIEYTMDDLFIGSLVGQKARKIEVELVSTFLPRVVIESLLTVVNQVGLEVDHLTLEPIAAANVVIPKEMFNFNLALVDIGAGTSDIALTKGGRMIGYAMVPVAGDEITEALAEHYLLDYHIGEKIKREISQGEVEIKIRNFLSQDVVITREEALDILKPHIESLADQICEAIMSINNKPPQAVICIGGGSLIPLLQEELASRLDLPPERVGIRESSDINKVTGTVNGVSSPQAVTPIGIGVTAHQNTNKANFLEVQVNNNIVQLFTLNKPSVTDALLAAEVDIKRINGRPGKGLTCTVNGELKVIKGEMGKPAHILVNGEEANLETPISSGDEIIFEPGQDGKNASGLIGDIVPELKPVEIIVNGNQVKLKPHIYQNGRLVEYDTPIIDGGNIEFKKLQTVRDAVSQILEIPRQELLNHAKTVTFNGKVIYIPEGDILILHEGKPVDLDIPLEDRMELTTVKPILEPTIRELCKLMGIKDRIKISFNSSELEIPVSRWNVKCNGRKVDFDYTIKDGDAITCQPASLNLKHALEHINYKVTPNFEENFIVKVNGERANLYTQIKNGDSIEIALNDSDRKQKSNETGPGGLY